jgi:hypothetical protein
MKIFLNNINFYIHLILIYEVDCLYMLLFFLYPLHVHGYSIMIDHMSSSNLTTFEFI